MGRPSRQQIEKHAQGRCYFCPEAAYTALDAHRLVPGRDQGRYHKRNIVVCCATCHRKVEAGEIQILGRHPTTAARYVLHVLRDGKEEWLPPPDRPTPEVQRDAGDDRPPGA